MFERAFNDAIDSLIMMFCLSLFCQESEIFRWHFFFLSIKCPQALAILMVTKLTVIDVLELVFKYLDRTSHLHKH